MESRRVLIGTRKAVGDVVHGLPLLDVRVPIRLFGSKYGMEQIAGIHVSLGQRIRGPCDRRCLASAAGVGSSPRTGENKAWPSSTASKSYHPSRITTSHPRNAWPSRAPRGRTCRPGRARARRRRVVRAPVAGRALGGVAEHVVGASGHGLPRPRRLLVGVHIESHTGRPCGGGGFVALHTLRSRQVVLGACHGNPPCGSRAWCGDDPRVLAAARRNRALRGRRGELRRHAGSPDKVSPPSPVLAAALNARYERRSLVVPPSSTEQG